MVEVMEGTRLVLVGVAAAMTTCAAILTLTKHPAALPLTWVSMSVLWGINLL